MLIRPIKLGEGVGEEDEPSEAQLRIPLDCSLWEFGLTFDSIQVSTMGSIFRSIFRSITGSTLGLILALNVLFNIGVQDCTQYWVQYLVQ